MVFLSLSWAGRGFSPHNMAQGQGAGQALSMSGRMDKPCPCHAASMRAFPSHTTFTFGLGRWRRRPHTFPPLGLAVKQEQTDWNWVVGDLSLPPWRHLGRFSHYLPFFLPPLCLSSPPISPHLPCPSLPCRGAEKLLRLTTLHTFICVFACLV